MNLDDALTHLARDPHADYDAAEIALHLARDEYPKLDVAAYLDQLRDLARDAREYMGQDSASRVVGLCKHLFHQIGYHGNQKEYYDPRNSYLNDVMDRLTGIPISLSVLVIAVGRRAGLPLVGLGLPGHFVVKCEGTEPPVILDPFHGGVAFRSRNARPRSRASPGRRFASARSRSNRFRWVCWWNACSTTCAASI